MGQGHTNLKFKVKCYDGQGHRYLKFKVMLRFCQYKIKYNSLMGQIHKKSSSSKVQNHKYLISDATLKICPNAWRYEHEYVKG